MANSLTPNQRSALNRALKHPELLPVLYRKVEGLHWFDVFIETGLLEPECNPPPKTAKKEGFFQIPVWHITEYLVKVSPLLKEPDNREYAIKFRTLLRNVTNYSKNEGFGNYRTWGQFAKVIKNIPPELLEDEDVEHVRYWITDKFDGGIISEPLGEWLLGLFDKKNEHVENISLKLLDALYEITYVEKNYYANNIKPILSFNSYRREKLTELISKKASSSFGLQAVDVFKNKLEDILRHQENDKWSCIWRPAIEEHSQNSRNDDTANIIVKAFRESVMGLFDHDKNTAEKYLIALFDSKFQTLIRVAIFTIDQKFPVLNIETSSKAVDQIYFASNYRHEVWHLLSNRFEQFSNQLKEKTLDIIKNLTIRDEGEGHSEIRNAYQKSIWLSALHDKDDTAKNIYDACLDITKTTPEHSDFSIYVSPVWSGHESPIALETLISLNYASLVLILNNFKNERDFRKPGIDGLARVFEAFVKQDSNKIYKKLDEFISLHIPYVYSLIDAFLVLWEKEENAHLLPWDNIWPKLLDYVYKVISEDEFWEWPESREDGAFVANHHWVVGIIGRLIKSGCQSDEHSFEVKNIELSKKILCLLIEKEAGGEFDLDSDAVAISINSPKGRCFEAIIALALFTCRKYKEIGITPLEAWGLYKDIFDKELNKPSQGEYEFTTLVANYLHHFRYLSNEWVINNLSIIFCTADHLRWLCTMQGYSYVSEINPHIYKYLKENGHLIKAIDDEYIKDNVNERYIQFITLAYLKDIEDLNDKNSHISILIKRAKYNELSQVIWFLWKPIENINEQRRLKVLQLWPVLLNVTDKSTEEGKKLFSQLCRWSVFIDKINEESKNWLIAVAPYAALSHSTRILLETISRLSLNYPYDAKEIWMAMLSEDTYDYPEDIIKEALSNLAKQGEHGIKAAKEIVGEYLRYGFERPIGWITEILDSES